MTTEQRLAKAKTALLLDYPFFGSLALSMPFVVTDEVPTAATDGTQVLFNPDFVDKLDHKELLFLVAHEVMHPVFDHHTRRGSRDTKLWNIAGDYVINYLLVQEQVGKMPQKGLYDATIYKEGNGNTDTIYDLLKQDEESGGRVLATPNGRGDPLDQVIDATGTHQELEQASQEMQIRVAQAAQAALAQGKLSAGLRRFADSVIQPTVNWRDVLHRFVQRAKNDQRTWSRPSRRFLSQGLFMPSVSGEQMGELVVAIDCSGSIGERELAQFAAEIVVIKDDMMPVAIHCVYFDSVVSHHETYTQADVLDIRPHGGGGTAFSPVIQFLADNDITPVACVFLTDLQCSDFGDAPDYPVLWVSNGAAYAPFGEVVMMEGK
jgi:predicted metal-dependent peptidase